MQIFSSSNPATTFLFQAVKTLYSTYFTAEKLVMNEYPIEVQLLKETASRVLVCQYTRMSVSQRGTDQNTETKLKLMLI